MQRVLSCSKDTNLALTFDFYNISTYSSKILELPEEVPFHCINFSGGDRTALICGDKERNLEGSLKKTLVMGDVISCVSSHMY